MLPKPATNQVPQTLFLTHLISQVDITDSSARSTNPRDSQN